jgi:predicted PurR-regulated permease PerM
MKPLNSSKFEIPFYIKTSFILVTIFVSISMLYYAQNLIVPIVFSVLLAIMLNPIVNFFIRLKINRIFSILIVLILSVCILYAFVAFVYAQLTQFSESWPIFVTKFTTLLNEIIITFSDYIDIKPQLIHDWISKTKTELINTNSTIITQIIVSLGSSLSMVLLVPVYIFVFLFYQPLLLEFIHKLFDANKQTEVASIVTQTKSVVQHYLLGLVIETAIVAMLDSAALLILGVDYAILLGVIAGLLNMIPYIGGIIAVALPMMVALVTKSSPMYAIYILIIFYIIQLVDNNYIVPKVVASKVKINALFSIIVVLAGNALWGVAGMFLSIPILAIVKVICDHIESLKPWGFLLGDTMPSILKFKKFKSKRMQF